MDAEINMCSHTKRREARSRDFSCTIRKAPRRTTSKGRLTLRRSPAQSESNPMHWDCCERENSQCRWTRPSDKHRGAGHQDPPPYRGQNQWQSVHQFAADQKGHAANWKTKMRGLVVMAGVGREWCLRWRCRRDNRRAGCQCGFLRRIPRACLWTRARRAYPAFHR